MWRNEAEDGERETLTATLKHTRHITGLYSPDDNNCPTTVFLHIKNVDWKILTNVRTSKSHTYFWFP
jgi:hypothetical protein